LWQKFPKIWQNKSKFTPEKKQFKIFFPIFALKKTTKFASKKNSFFKIYENSKFNP
jgi:hypothetical protein